MSQLIDVSVIREQTARALRAGGKTPWLVAFDAVGIQELVTASSRPIAMMGGSQAVKEFDEEARAREGCVFAGGGRGLLLVDGESRAHELAQELTRAYSRATVGSVLATASAPYDQAAAESSLTWLRMRLAAAKDEAPPPEDGIERLGSSRPCADCLRRPGEHASQKPNAPATDRICSRCKQLIELGRRQDREQRRERLTLQDLSEQGRIAVLAADGNAMGRLFAGLQGLEALAAVSATVDALFTRVHEEALASCEAGDRHVAPVTGGDDLRVFLAPEHLAAYVSGLQSSLTQHAEALGDLDGLLDEASARRLAGIGVGIGTVVADDHHPASRLLDLAHELESAAKTGCGPGAARSAISLRVIQGGDEVSGPRALERQPIDLADWDEKVESARRLALVPGAQRSRLRGRSAQGDPERLNLHRYQVARSDAWKDWHDAIGVDWRDRDALDAALPTGTLLDLAALFTKERRRA